MKSRLENMKMLCLLLDHHKECGTARLLLLKAKDILYKVEAQFLKLRCEISNKEKSPKEMERRAHVFVEKAGQHCKPLKANLEGFFKNGRIQLEMVKELLNKNQTKFENILKYHSYKPKDKMA